MIYKSCKLTYGALECNCSVKMEEVAALLNTESAWTTM